MLEVVGSVVDGQLRMEWLFGTGLHERATIERVADDFTARLERLIDHCLSAAGDSVGQSDLEEFDWDPSQLEDIAAAVQRAREGR